MAAGEADGDPAGGSPPGAAGRFTNTLVLSWLHPATVLRFPDSSKVAFLWPSWLRSAELGKCRMFLSTGGRRLREAAATFCSDHLQTDSLTPVPAAD